MDGEANPDPFSETDIWARRIAHIIKLVAVAGPIVIALIITLKSGLC